MSKTLKKVLVIISIVGLFLLVKSRIVSQSSFKLIVLMDMVDIKQKCLDRSKMKIINQNNNMIFDNHNYKDKFYNFYISKYGDTICNLNENQLKKIIEKDVKESFKRNWQFVY